MEGDVSSLQSPSSTTASINFLPEPFPHTFEDDEASNIINAIMATMDTPFKKSQDVPKSILVDMFGTQKAGKTKTTEKIEQVFKRHKFNLYCPQETAEIAVVRNKVSNDPAISQAIHLTGVQDYVLNLAFHPRYHMSIISRGLIDMLYWYERDRRKGNYSDAFCDSVRNHVFELLRMDLVDAFILFSCSVEAAMRREYEEALTQKRGSKMNEKEVAETLDIYNTVIEDVNSNVPNLPIFRIDTSDMTIREQGQEVLRFLLPTICRRFKVSVSRFLPQSPRLLGESSRLTPYFEEQLKLKGHPSREVIENCGFVHGGSSYQEDTYFNLDPSGDKKVFNEVVRIRKDDRGLRFMYKGPSQNKLLSCRKPLSFAIDEHDKDNILKANPPIAIINKSREWFENGDATLHLDKVEGVGDFTEIRYRGTDELTHTQELLSLAEKLGFRMTDMIEGNYLSLVLAKK